MKQYLLAFAVSSIAVMAMAADTYTVDPGHSQVIFSYDHAGYSTTQGMFSGFEGTIQFDANAPENSSVTVSIPAAKMTTGWGDRDQYFLKSGNFFKLDEHPLVTFTSTSIEVTGDDTAVITGDLSLNGVTKSVALDAKLNGTTAEYPFPPFSGKPAAGFSATASILRSDYNLGMFAPFVADQVDLEISIEAMKLD